MSNAEVIHQFGKRVEALEYVPRPSAYVLLQNDEGLVAVVRNPAGVFLPGGGVKSPESSREAAIREVGEECGIVVELDELLGKAEEYVHSEAKGAYFVKQCRFFRARAVGTTTATEADHELAWLSPEEAVDQLYHASQAWIVEKELCAGDSKEVSVASESANSGKEMQSSDRSYLTIIGSFAGICFALMGFAGLIVALFRLHFVGVFSQLLNMALGVTILLLCSRVKALDRRVREFERTRQF